MKKKKTNQPVWFRIFRLATRIVTLLFILFFLIMFAGETAGEGADWSSFGRHDWVILSLWAFYLLGLAVGLFREGLGGMISLVFMVLHMGILHMEQRIPPVFVLFLVPGMLLLLVWHFRQRLQAAG